MGSDQIMERAVPLSKRKVALILLGAIAFSIIGSWLWYVADTQTRYPPMFLKVVSLANLCFFGLVGVYAFVKLLDNRPGLIVDAEGIVDNSSAIAAGRVRWEEIAGLSVNSIAGQSFVTIEVTDPSKYLERAGTFSRMMNVGNMKLVGSPINISSLALRIEFEELVRVLSDSLEKYRRKTSQTGAE